MYLMWGSWMAGKYERELTYRLNPAREKSWIVASCREPLGMPSLSFIAIQTLQHGGHGG